MEQLPGNSDGLQPQELSSACNLPSVFDLTRNGEECLLKANSIEALHMVQPPSWYVSSGTSNGIVLPENDPNNSSQPNDQIQPDNAFSNTTVTLSYVSRSRVFSTHNSLSQHSQLIGVPISKTFSLHPTTFDANQLAGTDGAPLGVNMDQHCLQQVSVPVGLATCASSFEFVTPAQVVENVAGLCYLPQVHEISGIQDVESLALETLRSLQQSSPPECKVPLSLGEMQNGLFNAGAFDGGFPSGHVVDSQDQHSNGNPEVLFLISRTEEPLILQSSQGPAGLTMSLNQDFINAPEDPVSPAVESQNDIKDVFILPQKAEAPSEENSLVNDTHNTSHEELSNGQACPVACVGETDSSPLTDAAKGFSTSISELTGNLVDTCKAEQPEQSSDFSEIKEEGSDIQKLANTTLLRKELPPRIRRGMRLDAIVQNIYPTRYKCNSVSSISKSEFVNTQADHTAHLNSEQQASLHHNIQDIMEDTLCTVGAGDNERTARLQEEKEEPGVADLNRLEHKISTSPENVSNHLLDHSSPDMSLHQTTYNKKAKNRQKASKKRPVIMAKQPEVPVPELCRKRPPKQQMVNMGNEELPTTKKVCTSKKKRRKHRGGQVSIFSPQEPEIKLKYANYKEEKRERRDETFSPYVHMELKEYPTCTLVNYPEESAWLNRGKQRTPSGFASGTIPTTPCLQFGRVSRGASQQATHVCCLCGDPANALDLGDLHGPYYPEGVKPASRPPDGPPGPRAEDSSDSDFSHTGEGGCLTQKTQHELGEGAALGADPRCTVEGGLSVNRSQMELSADCYSPPVVTLETSEYWLHEDCCIWSAGVFLVRGKLYGLEKAVKMAKETICSCCYQTGATLGCIFKGCPNKYHYLCAVQSGCVLNEENFSMKCRKHMIHQRCIK
ncbi:uncharacterized protein LOC143510580 isoform X2 [Brachyhypopomus gauderio]|uniref:uncharacterized protein LOC143510580 isoform X2 n=1 Tax=Brachyhypopomus gauderio TaxID=698409 RepID=UPI004042989F